MNTHLSGLVIYEDVMEMSTEYTKKYEAKIHIRIIGPIHTIITCIRFNITFLIVFCCFFL